MENYFYSSIILCHWKFVHFFGGFFAFIIIFFAILIYIILYNIIHIFSFMRSKNIGTDKSMI